MTSKNRLLSSMESAQMPIKKICTYFISEIVSQPSIVAFLEGNHGIGEECTPVGSEPGEAGGS